MADPQTPAIGLYQPTRGSDSGTWDLPVNANSGAIDSLFSNVAVIGTTGGSVTLTTPPNSGAAWAGPYQSQSALIRFTGTLVSNLVVTIPRAGFYIMDNQTGNQNNFAVQLITGVGGGKAIGLPPGKKWQVFSDGTDMDYVGMPEAGTAYDLHGAVGLPVWMTACTVLPYLIKDGSIYNNSAYPYLAARLGAQFGGNPGLTFAVPDERARMRMAFDPNNTGRVNSTVNAGTMGSAGGAQALNSTGQLPQFTPQFTGTQQTVQTDQSNIDFGSGDASGPTGGRGVGSQGRASVTFTPSGDIAPIGAGSPSQALPPTIVSFLALIKTALLLSILTSSILSHMLPSNSSTNQIDRTIAALETPSNLGAGPSFSVKATNLSYFSIG